MPQTGMQLRLEGVQLVTQNNMDFVTAMRDEAIRFARMHGIVTSDDLRRIAVERGIAPQSPNAWGAIFHCNKLEPVGLARSVVPSTHGRTIRTWQLRR